ncbi:MAG: hypothetical protein Q9227_008036 [Pyrenula ochraceoflavens]
MSSITPLSRATTQPPELNGNGRKEKLGRGRSGESESDMADPEKVEQNRTPAFSDTPEETTNAPPTAQEEQQVTGIKLINIITAITLVCLLVLLDTSIVATAIPRITSDFHSLADIGCAALQPLTGKFFMNLNSKWTFMGFFFIFELGSLICGLANSSKMLIVGRAIAGMGTAGVLNGTFTIIAGCVPMAKRPTLTGLVMGISNIGLVMGPVLGGALTQYSTWRWCFYINLPIGGLVAAMLTFIHIPDQIPKPSIPSFLRSVPSKLDLIGFLLFAPAATQLLLALQWGGTKFAWNSAQTIGFFCGAGSTFIVFLSWEYYKGDAAMIPFSMVQKRVVYTSSLVYGFLMAQLFCTSYYLPVYFQAVKGQLFSSILSGWAVGRLGYYLPWIIVGAVMMAIANGTLSTLSPGTSSGKWIGYQIILGVGRGLGMQMPLIAVQNTLPPNQIPIVMALLMFSQNFGGALFLSFGETILTNSLKTEVPKYAPAVDPQDIINAGATGFRPIIDPMALHGVLKAYATSVDRVFYLTAGAGVACFVFAWGMGWKDIRKKKTEVSSA